MKMIDRCTRGIRPTGTTAVGWEHMGMSTQAASNRLIVPRIVTSVAVVLHIAVIAVLAIGAAGPVLPIWLRVLLASVITVEIVMLAMATWRPDRHWPLLFGVAAIKFFGALVTLVGPVMGIIDWGTAIGGASFDLVWSAILYGTMRAVLSGISEKQPRMSVSEALETARDQTGRSLAELSDEGPVLVVFLRHFGCTFCREALSDISKVRGELEKGQRRIAIVHMSTDDEAEYMLGRYGLDDVHRVSDPLRRLYRSFELRRGTLMQLLAPSVVLRGIQAALIDGHGIGRMEGDVAQLPGIFLVWKRELLKYYRHKTSADRPDYREIAACERCP